MIKRYGVSWPYAWQPMVKTLPELRELPGSVIEKYAQYVRILDADRRRRERSLDDHVVEGPNPLTYRRVLLQDFLESQWFNHGCPVYLLSPESIEAMLRTRIEGLELADFRLPHPVIEVRWPEGCYQTSPVALVQYINATELPRLQEEGVPQDVVSVQLYLQTWMQLDDPTPGIAGAHCRAIMWRSETCKVLPAMEDLPEWNDIRFLDEEKQQQHLALCLMLLATHAHDELFTPLLLSRDQDRIEGPERIASLHERAVKRTGQRTWVVGKYLTCPTIRKEKADESEPTDRKLKYRHWRAGHFHKVRFGEGRVSTRISWFRPTLVRPDLPVMPREEKIYQT